MKIVIQIECGTPAEVARVMAGISWAQEGHPLTATASSPMDAGQVSRGVEPLHVGDPPGTASSASTSTSAAPAGAEPPRTEPAKGKDEPPGYLYAKAKNLRQVVTEIMKSSGRKDLSQTLLECRQQRELGHPVLEAIAADDLPDRVEDAFMAVVERE